MSESNNVELARAVRETLRTSSRRRDAWLGMTLAIACSVSTIQVEAADLPVPCAAGSCGANVSWLTSGNASATVNGNTLNVLQTSNSATLNWARFNISADGVVNFQQPSASSTAINHIHQNDPSRIFGALNANGRVYLLNRNGVLFGEGAKVNVAGLVASSLKITDEALNNGLAGVRGGLPAFEAYTDAGVTLASGDVRIERGATITTSDGGQVLVFAPNVVNEGNISTPGGQTLLAAGSPVYLLASTDDDLRGLLVEVGTGGTVTNGNAEANRVVQDPTQLVGQIVAERGNVTLAGLAVNQAGRVSATTTVRQGGSIRLQARDGGSMSSQGVPELSATHGGTLTLDQRSVTEVTLSNDAEEVTVDANEQPPSQVQLQGHQVLVQENARVTATGGKIAVTARANPGASNPAITLPQVNGTTNDGSRIYLADGATLDVSGASVELAMERNVVRAELRGDELADSPVQRDGPLRGQAVFVDVRDHGTRADGSSWFGTPLGDVSGQISLINRSVAERNLNGGTVSLGSQGDVILADGSSIDLSGGSVTYRGGYINTSQLLGSDGKVYDIATADPNRVYVGTTATHVVKHQRWGVTETFRSFGGTGRFEAGYVEGKDAGELDILAPRAILDGAITADVTVGRHQRETATELAAGQRRPYEQLPLGGLLTLGRERETNSRDQVTGSILFAPGLVLPGLQNEAGSEFDPQRDALPTQFGVTRLRPELFGHDRVARVEIHSNERVELPADVSLQLPGQGEFLVSAAEIQVDGQVRAPSGTIQLQAFQTETVGAPDIAFDLGSTAVLDVSGRWVNDSALLNEDATQLAALLIDGGKITLSADDASLNLAAGSLIDVSAGAWSNRDGSVTAGGAGSIDLSAGRNPLLVPPADATLNLGATLRGYGVDAGGSLSISAPEICVASQGNCGSNALEELLTLRPEDLLAGGFGELSLTSNERDLTVSAGTNMDLRQRNLLLSDAARNAPSGTPMSQLASLTVLPDYLRAATNLTLRTDAANADVAYTNETFGSVGRLVIEAGAAINADAGATISLRSNSSLIVDGAINARSGIIDLRLDNTLDIAGPLNAQAIWLGANARLDASGTAILQPNSFGLRRGEVLDAGRVQILAERGAVIANPGSEIDVSGTSAVLDIGTASGAVNEGVPTLIASNGGTVDISAADGILLSGAIDAHAGGGSQAARGGELRLTLDGGLRRRVQEPAERRIVVTQDLSSVAVEPGGELPEAFARQARIGADDIEAAGFDSVTLTARTTQGTDTFSGQNATGVIEFGADVDLSAGRSVVLNAARITGDGDVHIAAPYVALGQTDTAIQQTPAVGAADSGAFQVSGQFVEVLGHSVIDGFESVRLNSEGDLRLRGVLPNGQSTITGSLRTTADLTLRADQVYTSTLSNFALSVENNSEGVLRIESTGQERATVLSAGSHLTVNAPTIEQAGVLRAPFGTIDLNADEVRLEGGSLTSTSAEGAIVPFGTTQAGDDWVYSYRVGTPQVVTQVVGDTTAVPQQTVSLDGEHVAIDAGAVIDVSGGGDLLAYEFVPGTTGTRDVLAAAEDAGQFAIVPGLNIDYAPFDPQESGGSALSVGDSVHISGGVSGLPEGDYVLLPARYALLEGAYLIKAADGYTDLQAGTTLSQLNGATIVSGRRIVADTQFADARTTGFEVRPSSVIADLARYTTSLASDFFAAQAERNDTAAPRLPQDAGVLAISAGARLDINGSLRAVAGEEGRGAGVDISAQNLRISAGEAADGEVVVSAESLARLGAESLLLGGRRSTTSGGTAIDVGAQNVTIDAGTSLSAPEILIAAVDTVRVDGGAAMTATGTVSAVDTYLVDGDSAVLRLASGDQAEIRRSNEDGVGGTLLLEQGAQLTAVGGALALDASLDARSEAQLALAGGSLSLGASRINLGAAPVEASGLTLDDSRLSSLNLDQLVLVSRSTIDLYGDVALDVKEVSLDAAGIRGTTQTEGGSITASDSIVLMNRSGLENDAVDPALGALALNASEIVLGEGEQRITGYESVTLNASTRVRGEDEGGLSVAGDLTLVTPAMVAATAANTTIAADGALRAQSPGSVAGVQGTELGGAFTLTGADVDISTRIEAAAGAVSLSAAAGDVTLSSGAVIDVAGRERVFDGVAVAAPAGDVKLSAASGNVVTQAGSSINVSAAGAGEAGSISVSAVAGTVALAGQMMGTSQTTTASGRFNVDAQDIGSLSSLNTMLTSGGFFAEREFHKRGAGDLVVDSGDTVRAHEVSLTADQGSVSVNGVIDARGARGGDVVLSASDVVNVSGSILASANAATGDGGDVALRGIDGITLGSRALIDVSAGADADEVGGDVDIRVTRDAARTLTDGDTTNNALALGGTIRGADRTTLEAVQIYADADVPVDINGDGEIDAALIPDGVITAQFVNPNSPSNVLYSDAVEFMSAENEAAIRAALGRADDESFRLLPGIEIQTVGDLLLGTETVVARDVVNWNLSAWRFGESSAPGVLTLRAGGDLTINGSLSDGFAAANGTISNSPTNTAYCFAPCNEPMPSDSWSYRLVAGADRGSADVMAVDPTVVAAEAGGDFTIAAGTAAGTPGGTAPFRMVRTGNGSIDVAAAGDFVLGNQRSVLYTAGVPSIAEGEVRIGSGTLLGLGGRPYPVDGGDISIDVQGDIDGAQTNQLVTDWLWRVGKAPPASESETPGYATAWTVNFARFEQNIGALGGGDVDISAGGDIRRLSASIPTIGRQVGSASADNSVVDIVGGGDLQVRAGGNIEGGSFYVGRGVGELQAGGDVTTARFTTAEVDFDLYPVLALGDAQWNVTARGDVGIEAIVNPTLLPQGNSQPSTNGSDAFNSSVFSTYSDDSAARIRAVSGDVLFSNNAERLGAALRSMSTLGDTANQLTLQIQPPTLKVAALSGDVVLSGQTTLYPAANSTVELFADGSVLRNEASSIVELRQSDADPAALPTIEAPHESASLLPAVLGAINSQEARQHAPTPVHAGDDSLAHIVARTGDVSFESSNQDHTAQLYFATPARIVAAGDIVELPLTVQHDDAGDISSLVAGGDIRYVSARSSESGSILRNSREINVDGPGLLQLAAGGEVDLQTSGGISTRGNVINTNLPDGGASISVMAGVSESEPAYAEMITRYLELGSGYDTDLVSYIEARTGENDLTLEEAQTRFEQLTEYRDQLVAYVESQSGRDDLTQDGALALFRGYTVSEQRQLLERVMFSELRFSGRAAAARGDTDVRRGFTALETMLPGSNPDTEAGEVNPYAGDIALYFSRIYTLDGGDISLLAPGGEVNVGLAAPPASFGLVKGAAELGLVAQRTGDVSSLSYRDFAVNESRVFAADGGNILVWSTDGDIDAGRGAKTAISAPAPTITFDENGRAIVNFPPALTGSGIQTLATSEGKKPGNVDLFAPRGVVNAGDAGIVAGNLTIAATAVLGADNIQVSGVSVGTQVDPGGLGASLAGVSAAASSATNSATTSVEGGRQDKQETTLADTALSWLEVFVVGLGEEDCRQTDVECLKRQKID
jgi:filamentous hemagglutinin